MFTFVRDVYGKKAEINLNIMITIYLKNYN